MSLINCPACNARVPDEPLTLDMPPEARCKREHEPFEGCPYEPLKAKCRGPWIKEVFKPLPPEECEAMYQALGPRWDRERYEREHPEED